MENNEREKLIAEIEDLNAKISKVFDVVADWKQLLKDGVGYCYIADLYTLESELKNVFTPPKNTK